MNCRKTIDVIPGLTDAKVTVEEICPVCVKMVELR